MYTTTITAEWYHPGVISVSVPPLEKDLIKAVPGARAVGVRDWTVPLSWAACLALRGVFGHRLEVGPALANWSVYERQQRVDRALALRHQTDAPGRDELRSYQRVGVEFMQIANRMLLGDDMGTGKGHPVSTRLLTPTGWRVLADLQPGDRLIGSDGRAITLTATHGRGELDVYRVEFNDGASVLVDGDHLWRVESAVDAYRGGSRVVETRTLVRDGVLHPNGAAKWFIPLVAPVEYDPLPSDALPVDPYVLGVLLGDGCLTQNAVQFAGHRDDHAIADEVAKRLAPLGVGVTGRADPRNENVISYAVTTSPRRASNPVKDALTKLGLMGHGALTKFIPEIYQRASVDERWDLLAGIIDTDGAASNVSHDIGVSSRALAEGVQELVEGLGGTARMTVRDTASGNPCYRLTVRFADASRACKLERKHVRPRQRPVRRSIRSITHEGRERVVCVSVDAPDRLYVTERHIVTHNTVQTAVALHELDAFPALIIAPAGVCRHWIREAERWTGRKLALGRGTAKQRRDAIEAVKTGDADGLVMNWENLRAHSRLAPYGSVRLRHCEVCDPDGFPGKKQSSCHRCEKELNEVPWVAIAADEAHRARDPQSQQTRAWWQLVAQDTVRYSFAMTGTPVDDTLDDLWSVMHGVAPDEYPVKSAFIDRYAMLTFNAHGGLEITGINPATRDEFFAFFDARFLRRPKEAVLPDLPPKTRIERATKMAPKQAKAYKELAKDMLTLLDDDEALMVFDPLTLTGRLNQAAASYLETAECDDCAGEGANKAFEHHASPHPEERYAATYCWCAEELGHRKHHEECPRCHGTGKVYVPALPSNKIDDLIEFVNENPPGTQMVIFAVSRRLLELASGELDRKGISHVMITGAVTHDQRDRNVDAFRAGERQLALVTIDAGGEGLDGLQVAGIAGFLQRHYSRLKNNQAEDRIHRIGQDNDKVLIVDFMSEDTIEYDKRAKLALKESRFQELVRDRETLIALIKGEGVGA